MSLRLNPATPQLDEKPQSSKPNPFPDRTPRGQLHCQFPKMAHFADGNFPSSPAPHGQYIPGPEVSLGSSRLNNPASQPGEFLMPLGREVPTGSYIPGPHGLFSLADETFLPLDQDNHTVLPRTVPYAVPSTPTGVIQHMVPALTYVRLYTILNTAKPEFVTAHGLLYPKLTQALRSNLRDGLFDCSQGQGSPQEVLQERINIERDIVNRWNQVNGGKANVGTDELFLFPCRRAAVEAGVLFQQPPPLQPVSVVPQQTEEAHVLSQQQLAWQPLRIASALSYTAEGNPVLFQWDTFLGDHGVRTIGIQPSMKGNEITSQAQPVQARSAITPKKRAGDFSESSPTSLKKRAKKSPKASATTPTEYAQNQPVQESSDTTPNNRANVSPAPSAKSPKKAPRVKGSYSPTFDLLRSAPSCNLPFPEVSDRPANVTVVELLVFMPQWLKSVHVIERLISNGGSCKLIMKIVNAHRNTAVPTYHNYWLHIVQHHMRARGDQTANGGQDYREWRVRDHIPLPNHDPGSIDIAGFRTYLQIEGPKHMMNRDKNTDAIPFRDLAKDLKQWPSEYDALNLTRCVQ
ncbi:uncharacterized protein N0V89_005341 [Didymosphaeria variabile]|uniref:Uncharacterized protein n=1 Tax=Didymosphaeria variabile TaxID=1932322 RepID=A0A9W8XKU8_9PLEO|nr:uncharacterized protein N0V89_005341 [Didymosphaeria variabile]KAJ4353611.1 hypothetical protein N0V89_005341 [Didymosphaeria variabile]